MDEPRTRNPDRSFRELMHGVREGSEEAAWELVARHGDAVRRAVRRSLSKELRTKFDSLDFVQIVWSSFFRARERMDRFERPEDLVAFLVKMTRNKVGMEVRRRLMTEKYNLNRETSLEELRGASAGEIADRQPEPIDVAIARERWKRMLENRPQHYRQIIQMRLQGRTYRDIADSLHLAESTVRRFIKRLFRETVA
jgi:RNA polymerase sigma factor (sigma-70 family)